MNRRAFFRSAPGALAAASARAQEPPRRSQHKIKRIRYFASPGDAAQRQTKVPQQFNQSANLVLVETESGLTGIGEGGSRDTMEQCAAAIIGMDAFRTEQIWQLLFRGYFYPAGREKLHAIGALDMALWDLKAKALGVPLYQLFGGLARDHIECYSTGYPSRATLKETAAACVADGYRTFRISTADGRPYDRFESVQRTYEMCKQVREGVARDGGWAIDFHTRLDLPDAVRLANMIQDLGPYFVEDLVRSENAGVYKTVRPLVKVPIAVGEQFGARWDINELVENRLIDFARVTVPNVGGITEFLKIAAICETHYVGLIPHFTGPVSEAALVHLCAAFSGPVLMEMLPRVAAKPIPYLDQCFDFRNGKLWPNDRPGIGVEFNPSRLTQIAEITDYVQPIPTFRRPDGSVTNW